MLTERDLELIMVALRHRAEEVESKFQKAEYAGTIRKIAVMILMEERPEVRPID